MNDLTHDELANNLAVHLMSDDRMVWEDIPAGKSGSVRPDVFTIQKSFSNPTPISYEVKVSLSDFRSDITKAKWSNYLDFSYGVIFAVPKGLVTKKDIPDGCGLICFNGLSWHTVKKPTLNPAILNGELLLKLLIGGSERETIKPIIKNRDFNEHMHNEKLRKKFGEKFAGKIKFLDEYKEKKAELNGLKKELASLFNLDINRWCFEIDVSYHIEQLKIMACETKRKSKIAKELEVLTNNISNSINRVIKNYTN